MSLSYNATSSAQTGVNASGSSVAGTAVSITAAAGDDIFFAIQFTNSGTGVPSSVQCDGNAMTLVDSQRAANISNAGATYVYRAAGAGTGSASSITYGVPAIAYYVAAAVSVTGVGAVSAATKASGNSTSVSSGSITVASGNLALCFYGSGNSGATPVTAHGGGTNRINASSGSGICNLLISSATATDTFTATLSGSQPWSSVAIVLSPLLTVAPSGIASAEAFGSASLAEEIDATGIASTEAFGSATVTPGDVSISPTGLASAEAFGSTTVALVTPGTIAPAGLASTEAFGAATINPGAVGISPTAIGSAEAFGTATAIPSNTVAPTGIVSAEAFGSATVTRAASPIPVYSATGSGNVSASTTTLTDTIVPTSGDEVIAVAVYAYPGSDPGITATLAGTAMTQDGSSLFMGNVAGSNIWAVVFKGAAASSGSQSIVWTPGLAVAIKVASIAYGSVGSVSTTLIGLSGNTNTPHVTASAPINGHLLLNVLAQVATNPTFSSYPQTQRYFDHAGAWPVGLLLGETAATGSPVTFQATSTLSGVWGGLIVDILPAGSDRTLSPSGIPSAEAFGNTIVTFPGGPQYVSPTGLASAEAFGTANFNGVGNPFIGSFTKLANNQNSIWQGVGDSTLYGLEDAEWSTLYGFLGRYAIAVGAYYNVNVVLRPWNYPNNNAYNSPVTIYTATGSGRATLTVYLGGWPAASMSNYLGSMAALLPSTAADVVILHSGFNEDVSDSTYTAKVTSFINQVQATYCPSANIVVTTENATIAVWESNHHTNFASIFAALTNLLLPGKTLPLSPALQLSTAFTNVWEIDTQQAFTAVVANGTLANYLYGDGLHPIDTGYALISTWLQQQLAIQVLQGAILPTGIPSAGAFGTTAISAGAVSITPTGIPSSEAFGTTIVGSKIVAPTGIASSEAFGTANVIFGTFLAPTGIGSAEAFGTPTVAGSIVPTGIPSAQAVGIPTVSLGQAKITVAGISSAQAFGSPTINLAIPPRPPDPPKPFRSIIRYPTGPITPHGAYYLLKNRLPTVGYLSYDQGVVFNMLGGPAIAQRTEPERVTITSLKGLVPPWKNIAQKGATQDGETYLTSLYDPCTVDLGITLRARDPIWLRKLMRDWSDSWDAKQTGEFFWETQELGRWWSDVRWAKQPIDALTGGVSPVPIQKFVWSAIAYDSFYKTWDSCDQFVWGAPGNKTFPGGESGWLQRTNIGDQPMNDEYTCVGPGTFGFADGPGSTNSVVVGPILANQVIQVRTDPRKRGVVDLTSKPPTPQALRAYQAAIVNLVNFVSGGNPPPLLQAIESYFGILLPQGNLYSLLNGRFSDNAAIPPKAPGKPAAKYHVSVSIAGGAPGSMILCSGTPRRRYPW